MGVNGVGTAELRIGEQIVDMTPFLQRLIWTESLLDGGWSWCLELATESWSEWSSFLIGSDQPRRMLRLRATEGSNAPDAVTDWRTAIVDTSRAAIRGEAMTFRIEGADKRLEMAQKARTRAWTKARVSQTIRRIGAEYDMILAVDETAALDDRYQTRETDWEFMSRLRKETATSSGRGDVYMWVDENTLNFRAINFAAPAVRRHDFAVVENRSDCTVVDYRGRAIDRMGGATTVGVGYDLDKQAPIVFRVGGAAAGTMPALANRVPRPTEDGLRVVPFSKTDAFQVEEATRGWWAQSAPRYFSIRMDGKSDLSLRPGTVIEIQANLDERRRAPFYGRFAILEVQHQMIGAEIKTTAVGFRREAFQGEEDSTGAAASAGNSTDHYQMGSNQPPRIVLTAERIP